VQKSESAVGWHTSAVPWNGFDYAGPYPALRARIFAGNPWQCGYFGI
jgi:hypothetical protein